MSETERSIWVTNLASKTDAKKISEFFSFCGKIEEIFLKESEGSSTKSAVIRFESEHSAKTALLLNNAIVDENSIGVVPYSPEAEKDGIGSRTPKEHIHTRHFPKPPEQTAQTSIISDMLAQGYVLAENAFAKAHKFDEEYLISMRAKIAMTEAKNRVEAFDKQYEISEKANAAKKEVIEKAQQLDETYKISEKLQNVKNMAHSIDENYQISKRAEAAMQDAREMASKATSNPTIARALATLESWRVSLSSLYTDYKAQVEEALKSRQSHSQPQ